MGDGHRFGRAVRAHSAGRRGVTRACVEAVFSILAALLSGWFVAPAICVHLHITEIDTVSPIGLGVGLVFWQAVPILKLSSKLQPGATS